MIKYNLRTAFPLILQAGVGIISFLILWLIISALPMLQEIDLPLDFTLTELVNTGILTVVIVILVNFGSRLELRLGYIYPHFPQMGTMAKSVAFLIAILIAYRVYLPLLEPYLSDLGWIYSVTFLILFVAVLVMLARIIYLNVEDISAFIAGSKKGFSSTDPEILCKKCGESNRSGSKFCSVCGAELPQPTEHKCKNCAAALKPGVKFCASCGAQAEEEASSAEEGTPTEETQTPQSEPSVPTCVSCGAELKPGAKFCASCGTAQE